MQLRLAVAVAVSLSLLSHARASIISKESSIKERDVCAPVELLFAPGVTESGLGIMGLILSEGLKPLIPGYL